MGRKEARLASAILLALCFSVLIIPAHSQLVPNRKETPIRHECLIRLRSADENFARKLEAAGLKVAGRSSSGVNWLVEDVCTAIGKMENVTSVASAITVIVTFKANAAVREDEVENLGGIVLNRLNNLNIAIIAIPETSFTDLAHLPGIERIRKDYTFSASDGANTNRPK